MFVDQREVENILQTSYTELPSSWTSRQYDLQFTLTLLSPSSEVTCTDNLNLKVTPADLRSPFRTMIAKNVPDCGPMNEEGKWTVTLRQKGIDKPFTYKLEFYVLQTQHRITSELHNVWTYTEAMTINKTHPVFMQNQGHKLTHDDYITLQSYDKTDEEKMSEELTNCKETVR